MHPSQHEVESRRVLTLLHEVGLESKLPDYYGRTETIHEDTARLCEWIGQHPDTIREQSLEMQIWWRDHQLADKAREAREALERKREELRASALNKLTAEELDALKS